MQNKETNIIIRPAEARDAEQLAELLHGICLLHCEGRPDIFRPSAKYDRDTIVGMISDSSRPVLVADIDGKVAGYAFCVIKGPAGLPVIRDFTTLYIDDFCVAPEYRRRGVGTAIFEAVKKLAESVGAYHIDLNVWAFNTGAIEFYKSLGMTPERMHMEYILGGNNNGDKAE